MPLHCTLLVDTAETFNATFPDSESLAADAVSRASAVATHFAKPSQIAADIASGATTIELRPASPAITIEVRAV